MTAAVLESPKNISSAIHRLKLRIKPCSTNGQKKGALVDHEHDRALGLLTHHLGSLNSFDDEGYLHSAKAMIFSKKPEKEMLICLAYPGQNARLGMKLPPIPKKPQAVHIEVPHDWYLNAHPAEHDSFQHTDRWYQVIKFDGARKQFYFESPILEFLSN